MRIGVDLGGTKIEAIALSQAGDTLARVRVPTPRDDYAGTISAIVQLVHDVEQQARQSGAQEPATVGVGLPGAISPASGLIKNANSTWLNGRPFDRDLAAALARPVLVENDANCFTVSEAVDGAAAGARMVFGVIVGTGCGGGIVVDGRPWRGRHAIAGEWGHNPLPWTTAGERPGPACYCGKSGCLETFLSGPGIERDHLRTTGVSLGLADIDARAQQGDEDCEATLARFEDRLARSLATLVNVLDPDVIVVGGGVSNLTRLYQNVPPLLAAYAFSDVLDVPLVRARHGDSSGVRGAAWLWRAPDV